MAVTSSRRDLVRFGCGTAAAFGISAVAPGGMFNPARALAQGAPATQAPTEDSFYRDDWFGEPWRKPETAAPARFCLALPQADGSPSGILADQICSS